MFKTIYRLRVFDQETAQHHPIHLCGLKDKQPTFNDLVQKIQRITKTTHLDDYEVIFSSQNTEILLKDDQSFQKVLRSLTLDQQRLDISLKSKHKHSIIKDLPRLVENPLMEQDIPVIKPTVLRWTPHHHHHHHEESEPYRKKQRTMMTKDHPRKLPEPTATTPPHLPLIRNSMLMDYPLHPLDMKKPSTTPLSSPPSPRLSLTLPTLSSITQPCSLQKFGSQHLAPIRQSMPTKPSKRTRASVGSTHHNHINSGVFLCEHAIGKNRICGQTFRRSYDLSRHQTIHLENRPFCSCHQCGKKFTRMDALRRHERVQGHHSSKHRSMSTSALPPLDKK
ncbi:uncharacterized protein B0P05DRAFT_518444 [Gilbertella persicaria]|uniref:uncharacterized protein n=1 Tax=Gilbertella persicaria TaxID=101096 RepID=UPI00221E6CF3|nr:uncharacterized protein B0P05DRAFT_518444 [Gilbertella persicaria]KAI8052616.1 hypothetical protein B0P05DRAFT_518444 [Gilbertella persicaria]